MNLPWKLCLLSDSGQLTCLPAMPRLSATQCYRFGYWSTMASVSLDGPGYSGACRHILLIAGLANLPQCRGNESMLPQDSILRGGFLGNPIECNSTISRTSTNARMSAARLNSSYSRVPSTWSTWEEVTLVFHSCLRLCHCPTDYDITPSDR